MVGDDAPWLTRLVGGLPADFDYGVIRSADDARSHCRVTIVGWRRAVSMHVALGDHAIAIRGYGFDPGDAWNCRKPPGDASALR